jgi:neutral ceramidase
LSAGLDFHGVTPDYRRMGLFSYVTEFVESLIGMIVITIGPWPATAPQPVERMPHYQAALAQADECAKLNQLTKTPGRLKAGWAKAELTPPAGTPLAGYGARDGAPSTGVHDPLFVKALAVSDGDDTAVIVGADMLVVPENVAEEVRRQVAAATGLSANAILFNATHTHSGAGGGMPGLVPRLFAGRYDPALPKLAIKAFTKAIVKAHAAMKPARLAHGKADAGRYIRNRTRAGETDGSLRWLVVEREGGERCVLVRFSAHATIIGSGNMEFSGDYPGFVQRIMTAETRAECIFLAGAVGSMSPANTGDGDDFQQCEHLARGLVRLIRPGLEKPVFKDALDVATIGVPVQFPSLEIRLAKHWRLSPFAAGLAGVDDDAWIGAVRLGDVILAGLPADYSGELAIRMAAWAENTHGVDLWMNSFCGDYLGYISPDAVYNDPFDHPDPKIRASSAYEGQVMSWIGPRQEAFFDGIVKRMVERLRVMP